MHLTAKAPVVPLGTMDAELQPLLAKAASRNLVPFYGAVPKPTTAAGGEPSATGLAPPARTRLAPPPPGAGQQTSSTSVD